MANADLAHWSRFWDQGYITTLGDTKPRNYDGVVREFWHEKFAELPQRARILDIATGNGAIATIAAEAGIALDKDFFVAATDLADIQVELIGDERTKQARQSIVFYSRTPCEQQPFDDDSFEMVTSQFGFEYSDIDRTLAEIRRVLVPGGRFVALSHHIDSSLADESRGELAIYSAAIDELDLLGETRKIFEALGDIPDAPGPVGAGNEAYAAQAEVLNRKVREFQERFGDDERSQIIVGTIGFIARTAKQTTAGERFAALDKASADFRDHRERLLDMVAAALDPEAIDELAARAREAGFESVHCLKFYAGDNRLGAWQIHMR